MHILKIQTMIKYIAQYIHTYIHTLLFHIYFLFTFSFNFSFVSIKRFHPFIFFFTLLPFYTSINLPSGRGIGNFHVTVITWKLAPMVAFLLGPSPCWDWCSKLQLYWCCFSVIVYYWTLNIYIIAYMYIHIWIFSYDIHVRSLSYIVFDECVSNKIITQKIIVIGPCNL
jgi:hypothetical protein